jgi:DNA polymerase-3 subunit delta
LLILCGKLDAATLNSRWFSDLEKAGTVIQVWPVDARHLPAWIAERMRHRGLRPSPEVTTLLAERVEGNLLAAAQEVDKLFLLFGAQTITVAQLLASAGLSARYSVYDLVDTALAGNPERTTRILNGLRGEGVQTSLASWALHREIRLLSTLAFELANGAAVETALARHRVWEKRKPLLRRALQRLPLAICRRLLYRCSRLDQQVKGVESGDPWDELTQLSLALAGRDLLKSPFSP